MREVRKTIFTENTFGTMTNRASGTQEECRSLKLNALVYNDSLLQPTSVFGNGYPDNGVINHPCDNKKFDQQGERNVANALLITKVQ